MLHLIFHYFYCNVQDLLKYLFNRSHVKIFEVLISGISAICLSLVFVFLQLLLSLRWFKNTRIIIRYRGWNNAEQEGQEVLQVEIICSHWLCSHLDESLVLTPNRLQTWALPHEEPHACLIPWSAWRACDLLNVSMWQSWWAWLLPTNSEVALSLL